MTHKAANDEPYRNRVERGETACMELVSGNVVCYPGVTPKQKGLAAELLTPWKLVELSGVEPLTSCMPCKRSTS